MDPSGHSWKSFWKKVENFFEDFGNLISPLGRAIITGDWKSFGMILVSITAAVLSFGIMAALTPMVMTLETVSVIAVSAAETAMVLDTKPGGWLINQVSSQIFDDVFGMRPGEARMWGSAFTYMAVNAVFQAINANLVTGGEKVTSRNYTPGKDKALDVEVQKVLDKGKGFNYGSYPKDPTQVSRVLFNKTGELVGVASKGNVLMLGAQHTGIVMKDISSLQGRISLKHFPNMSHQYGLWGISHQAVNVSLLEAGYSSTVMSVGGGWTTVVSTVVYGPYGGGLTGAVVASQELSK